jgi:DNA-binding transcriptional LysR family regulator
VKFDWNDRRFFAAMLENCTTARAAPAIGVDQTTVARRIAALEAPSKIDLFERDHAGYRPTSSGANRLPFFRNTTSFRSLFVLAIRAWL